MLATALVVFHHAALTYGASGGWYWHERPAGSSLGLTLFVMMNQAWFMGLFFLIAGHFTPPSFDRKGARRFLGERLYRLGIPLAAYALLLDPLTNAVATWHDVGAAWLARLGRLPLHPGPLWFAEALLAFNLVYAALRQAGLAQPKPRRFPTTQQLLAAAALVGAAAFAIRLAYPVDRTWADLLPGYFAGYLILFAAGVAGAPANWLGHVPGRAAAAWFGVSLLALCGIVLSIRLPGPPSYAGGWGLKAAFYAFWEPFFACGVILGLLWASHRFANRPTPLAAWLARRAFACYIIHPPILVAVTRLLQSWAANAAAKTLVAGASACLLCLLASSVLLLVPGVRRVV